jgi:hypothetical protein
MAAFSSATGYSAVDQYDTEGNNGANLLPTIAQQLARQWPGDSGD